MLHILQVIRVGVCLLLAAPRIPEQVVLEPFIKVVHAHESVHDRQDDQQDGDDRKSRQGSRHRLVVLLVAGLVDSHQLEQEIGQPAEVEQDDARAAEAVLVPRELRGGEEDQDRNGDGGDG
jgi:hypothetical protein